MADTIVEMLEKLWDVKKQRDELLELLHEMVDNYDHHYGYSGTITLEKVTNYLKKLEDGKNKP